MPFAFTIISLVHLLPSGKPTNALAVSLPILVTFISGYVVASVFVFASCNNNPYPDADESKKVLYTSFVDAPRTLDPAVAYTTASHAITGNVYDTLLEYHYLKRPFELIPGLAEQIPDPETLEDGRVRYRFRLRPDLLFQEDPSFERGGVGRSTRPIRSSF